MLIGDDDVVLSSPIILYDHPEVAPQSPGDLYDATEIDEILALRVMTLTDEEKSEARGTDSRAAAIIDRCDDMSPETLEPPARADAPGRPASPTSTGSRGADAAVPWWDPAVDASVDPWTDTVLVGGVEVARARRFASGRRRRADAQDMFLAG